MSQDIHDLTVVLERSPQRDTDDGPGTHMHLTAKHTDRIVSAEISGSETQMGVSAETPRLSRQRSRQWRCCATGISSASSLSKETST